MSTQTAIIVGLVIYGCMMLAVSMFFMARVKKAADYLVAGRGLPYWVLTGTIVGTCIGTGVVIGASGLAYQHGWAGCAYPIGLGFGTVLAGWFFAVMRRHKFMTLSEEVACYYGGNRVVVEFSNISLFLSQLCWLTVQIMGGAAVLSVVTGLRAELCTVLSGFITAIITIPGGLKTVVYTDFLQAAILLCGFACLTNAALDQSGGLTGLCSAVPADYFSFLGVASFGGWKVVSLILTLVLGVLADPELLETNARGTQEIINLVRLQGISVEAEIGHIIKSSDASNQRAPTVSVAEAKEFTSKVDVDLLAVAVGSTHGIFKEQHGLDFALMSQLRSAVRPPLVLHGTCGISMADITHSVKAGMTKINFGEGLRMNYIRYFNEFSQTLNHEHHVWRIARACKDKLKEDIKQIIRAVGSEGKAAAIRT